MRRPGLCGRRLCSALGGGSFKGPAVGRTWGPPSSRGSPVVTGKTMAPLGRTLLPACLVDPSFSRKVPQGAGVLGDSRVFLVGRGYVRLWPLLGENVRLLRAGCSMGGWRRHQSPVGLRCEVKLPRRAFPAAARGRRRQQAAGWRHIRCVHSSASLWGSGWREGCQDYPSGLGPADERVRTYVCVCPAPPRLFVRPCFFIPQGDRQYLARQLITEIESS